MEIGGRGWGRQGKRTRWSSIGPVWCAFWQPAKREFPWFTGLNLINLSRRPSPVAMIFPV